MEGGGRLIDLAAYREHIEGARRCKAAARYEQGNTRMVLADFAEELEERALRLANGEPATPLVRAGFGR